MRLIAESKGLSDGRRPSDGLIRDVNSRVIIRDDEQLKRWKKHLTTVFNRITSDEVPPFVDEIIQTKVKLSGPSMPLSVVSRWA